MTRSFLTDDQKWQIVNAPREVTDDELATAFGQSRSTVHHARWHFRTQGWTCSVSYGSCTVCGEPLLRRGFRTGRLLAHPACRAGVAPAYYRAYQQQRRDAYSGAEMEAALFRAHEHTRRNQELTKGRDHSRHQLWTPEDDEAIQHPAAPPDHELALELGRTLKAVRSRRYILRQQASRTNREPLDPQLNEKYDLARASAEAPLPIDERKVRRDRCPHARSDSRSPQLPSWADDDQPDDEILPHTMRQAAT